MLAGARTGVAFQYGNKSECNSLHSTYDSGETATYKIYYNWKSMWMSAGTVNFKVANSNLYNKSAYKITAEGKTFAKFDWFYKVRDYYETYVDPETKLPLKFVRNIKEGSYSQENMYTFYHDKGEVLMNYYKRKGKLRSENVTDNISPCAQDLLSSIYYARCLDYSKMKVGDKLYLDLYLDGEIYPIYLKYLGKEVVDTDLGKFRCVKFSPTLLEGDVFKGNDEMVIYSTDDDNRVPLLIESPLTVGSVKCYLTNIGGLKYPMASKVN